MQLLISSKMSSLEIHLFYVCKHSIIRQEKKQEGDFNMRYRSTRNSQVSLRAKEAVLQGLSQDGGLFVPENMPAPVDLEALSGLSYQDLSLAILPLFLDDYSQQELREAVSAAYSPDHFDSGRIAPISLLDESTAFLQLWHGPTCAFKDLALTVLPHLLSQAYADEGRTGTVCILTATSGDTGKAALSGFANVPHTALTVFYPKEGVSPIQERQMVTSRGANVNVVAVQGNFDDCQRLVKQAYGPEMAGKIPQGVTLSSANSINIGRLVPQIVYYFSAYFDLVRMGALSLGEKVNFAVPTGNFGDILAGWLARQIGLPVGRLICASNQNNVLTDFIRTGTYSIHRPFHVTMSPSMDILVSSNLERLLYYKSGGDDQAVANFMKDLAEKGNFTIPPSMAASIREEFCGFYTDEEQCRQTIRGLYQEHNVLIDPHTSIAVCALHKYRRQTRDDTPAVVLSTASPFKFASSVLSCLDRQAPLDPFAALQELSRLTGRNIPAPLAELPTLPIRFTRSIRKEDGLSCIQDLLEEIAHA